MLKQCLLTENLCKYISIIKKINKHLLTNQNSTVFTREKNPYWCLLSKSHTHAKNMSTYYTHECRDRSFMHIIKSCLLLWNEAWVSDTAKETWAEKRGMRSIRAGLSIAGCFGKNSAEQNLFKVNTHTYTHNMNNTHRPVICKQRAQTVWSITHGHQNVMFFHNQNFYVVNLENQSMTNRIESHRFFFIIIKKTFT